VVFAVPKDGSAPVRGVERSLGISLGGGCDATLLGEPFSMFRGTVVPQSSGVERSDMNV